jgi:hypothetical protein
MDSYNANQPTFREKRYNRQDRRSGRPIEGIDMNTINKVENFVSHSITQIQEYIAENPAFKEKWEEQLQRIPYKSVKTFIMGNGLKQALLVGFILEYTNSKLKIAKDSSGKSYIPDQYHAKLVELYRRLISTDNQNIFDLNPVPKRREVTNNFDTFLQFLSDNFVSYQFLFLNSENKYLSQMSVSTISNIVDYITTGDISPEKAKQQKAEFITSLEKGLRDYNRDTFLRYISQYYNYSFDDEKRTNDLNQTQEQIVTEKVEKANLYIQTIMLCLIKIIQSVDNYALFSIIKSNIDGIVNTLTLRLYPGDARAKLVDREREEIRLLTIKEKLILSIIFTDNNASVQLNDLENTITILNQSSDINQSKVLDQQIGKFTIRQTLNTCILQLHRIMPIVDVRFKKKTN